VRPQLGKFVWKGKNQGDYLPVRFLPLPQSQQLLDFNLAVTPTSNLVVTGEFANSILDANRFSSLDDNDNNGHALKFSLSYAPRNVTIGGSDIGGFDFKAEERFVNKRFVPIDRTDVIEFNRKWGIDTVTQVNEEIQELSLRYLPTQAIIVGGGYGKITRGDVLRSVRNDASLVMKDESLPTTDYYIESVRSSDVISDNSSSWLRQKGLMEYDLWKVTPRFRYEGENRKIKGISTSALEQGSFRYDEFAPGITLKDFGNITLFTEYEWRTDNVFNAGSVVRESKSFTQSYQGRLSQWNDLTSSLDITLREKKFSKTFKEMGNSDIKTVLVRNQSRYTPFNRGVETDLFYEVATERSSRLERVFLRVAEGTGNYRYLGDLNNNGITDESEFELARFDGDYVAITVPTDELFPVIDLKTSVRVRLKPSLLFQRPQSTLGRIASIVSTETYVRVDEKSTEPDLKQIYLLHFSKFQLDSTTISGSTIFTQDVHLFEGQPSFSARFRYSQRKGLNRFSSGIERNYARERSIRLRWQLVREISNQIDYVNKLDGVTGAQSSNRLRDIVSNSVAFDLSYRPEQNVEFGLKVEVAKSTDRFPVPEVGADLNAQTLRFVYSFQGAGRARVETAREEILLGTTSEMLPFELTGGRVAGKTWLWRAAFDYRVTQFIQATVNYDGRSEGGRSAVHTARAEVRAFF
jgi:hypothetical protein